MTLCGRTPRESIEVRPDDKEPIVVPGPVLTDPADVTEPVDVVLLAVKDTQNEQAGAWLARLCDEHTVVCALQNGVEQVERVGRFCPRQRWCPRRSGSRRSRIRDGWIRLRTGVRLVLPVTDAAETLADAVRPTQTSSVELDPDFISAAWHKLLVNAVVGLMVLTGRRIGHVPPRGRRRTGARAISQNVSRSRAPMARPSATR